MEFLTSECQKFKGFFLEIENSTVQIMKFLKESRMKNLKTFIAYIKDEIHNRQNNIDTKFKNK